MPSPPDFTGPPVVSITGTSNTEILVAAEVNAVTATSGPMGQYKLTALSPDPAAETITPNPSNNDTNMTIGALSPGTSYNLTFVNVITLCGSPAESPVTEVIEVCTSKSLYPLIYIYIFSEKSVKLN